MIRQVLNHIQNSEKLLLASHVNPDGDSVGSLTAMGLSLELMGKKATLYSESAIPAVYRFLPAVDRIKRTISRIETFDAAIILDCTSLDRVGVAAKAIERIPTLINIDHHATNTNFGHVRLVDIWACAAAELVYGLIKESGIRITKGIATSIYTGILTDTGSFRFSNTNENSFAVCKEMVECGVDPSFVAQRVYGPYSLGRLKLLNLALDSIEISENGRLSVMTLTQDMLKTTRTRIEDADGFLNYAGNIKNIKVAVLIQQQANGAGLQAKNVKTSYHVSLRSDGSVDVASMAFEFGGGGHRTAAGFCSESTLSELKTKIFELAKTI